MNTPQLAAVAVFAAASCGAGTTTADNTAEPTTTTNPPPSTVWQTTLLPPPLTEAVATTPALRGQQIQVSEPPAAPPTTTIPIPPHYDIWLELAECESGGDWAINTGNGFYGGLQFTLSSWRGAGGTVWASRPHLASAIGQMWTAEVLLGFQGWGAWPACSRRLGLR